MGVFLGGGSELKNEANSNIYWILEKRNWEGGGCYDELENEALVDGSYRDLAEN